ncbi:hypothetical protein [Streptomyces sp. NPDC008125]
MVGGATEPVTCWAYLMNNVKSQREKLTPEQRIALAGLGLEWAA